ncbi:MAG: phosphoribosylamine--glycine ligase [Nitrospirota bacterium]
MKVLVIGGGSKEHAIVWRLSQSRHVNKIYCCPGNAGIAEKAEIIDAPPDDFNTLIDFVKYEWIDLTVADNPELLWRGVVDTFRREGCSIFGAHKSAARLSSSRVFAKDFMRLHGIPSAEYRAFSSYIQAEDFVRLKGAPIVIKADGRSPKGDTFFAPTVDIARDVLNRILQDKVLGEAGRQIIIEERIQGDRLSILAVTDGVTILPFASLLVYRSAGSADGSTFIDIGARSPAISVGPELELEIRGKILKPLLKALQSGGLTYKGMVSADIVVRNGAPFVFDLNCCFQGLEAQTVLPRLRTDYVEIVSAAMKERLSEMPIELSHESSFCVEVSKKSGRLHRELVGVSGLDKIRDREDVMVFHENTFFENHDVVAPEGRVMCVTAWGGDMRQAATKAFQAAEQIQFKGMYYSKDMGKEIS